MSLVDHQDKFAGMLSKLIEFAHKQGYQVTLGEGYVEKKDNRRSSGSLHYLRLAQDINLFKDGKYIETTEGHKELGFFWECLGGSWGGRFNDGNHYSLEWKGRK